MLAVKLMVKQVLVNQESKNSSNAEIPSYVSNLLPIADEEKLEFINSHINDEEFKINMVR